MIARLLLVLSPVLAAVAWAVSAYHLYIALLAVRRGDLPFAGFYLLFALGGIALGTALWQHWRRARAIARSSVTPPA